MKFKVFKMTLLYLNLLLLQLSVCFVSLVFLWCVYKWNNRFSYCLPEEQVCVREDGELILNSTSKCCEVKCTDLQCRSKKYFYEVQEIQQTEVFCSDRTILVCDQLPIINH